MTLFFRRPTQKGLFRNHWHVEKDLKLSHTHFRKEKVFESSLRCSKHRVIRYPSHPQWQQNGIYIYIYKSAMTKPISYSRRVISQGKNIIEHQKMFRKDVIWTCLKIGYTGIPIIWVPKIGYPQIIHFEGKLVGLFMYKPSILGSHCRKPQ